MWEAYFPGGGHGDLQRYDGGDEIVTVLIL
jgi:hypothetical protein